MNFIRQLEILKKSGEESDFTVHCICLWHFWVANRVLKYCKLFLFGELFNSFGLAA